MPGRPRVRTLVAIIAVLAALAVGITAVWSVASSVSSWNLRTAVSDLRGNLPPARTDHKVLSAKGLRSVVISSTAGNVDVTTGKAARLQLRWTVPGNPRTALAVHENASDIQLDFTPPNTSVMIGDEDVLKVTLPADLAVSVDTGSGDIYCTGQFRDLHTTSDSGDLHVTDFRGLLTAKADSGDLYLHAVVAEGPLALTSGSGDISFSGDPGLAASVLADSGDVDMAIRPRGRLHLHVEVDSGAVSSALAPLTANADGTEFSGSVGSGSPGSLNIVTDSGDVSLTPWQE